METLRASRLGVPLRNYRDGRSMQDRAVTVFCVYDDGTFEIIAKTSSCGGGSINRGWRQRW
jgi:hypothetical protein